MSSLANGEDPDEMPHNVTLHLGLHSVVTFKEKHTTLL